MRIYLQTLPDSDKPPRFCHLILQKDLLDGWNLVRESGTQGRPGRTQRQHFTDLDEAQNSLETARDAQVKRGFKVVFMDMQRY